MNRLCSVLRGSGKETHQPRILPGTAHTLYCLHDKAPTENTIHLLRQATKSEPDNGHINILLALTLQPIKKEAEGYKLVDENTKSNRHSAVQPNITEIKVLWTQL